MNISKKVGDKMTAQVLVEIKAKRIDKTFTYNVPKDKEKEVMIGKRVLVPFGKQKVEGFILKIENDKIVDYELKDILEVIDEHPVINEEMIEIGKYISKKTLSTLICAYQTMLPTALKAKKGFNVNKKMISYLKIIDRNYEPKNKAQEAILNLFIENDKILKKQASDISASAIKTLINNNVIEEIKEEEYRINIDEKTEKCSIILNKEQKNVIETVTSNLNEFIPYLLYGVTGSGKTEVYMHIIEEVLKNGKEIIVLVPEISLTPQIVNQFRKRFGSRIAILHSRLNDGEKYDEWRKIERKEVSIVIGARSAIFAPFTNLGLIIIDEEHTSTYKQENNPKYKEIDKIIEEKVTILNNIPIYQEYLRRMDEFNDIIASSKNNIEKYINDKI